MTVTPSPKWDRHSILAEIKRQYGSLREFAVTTEVSDKQLSAALSKAYPRVDRIIAAALGAPLNVLWPRRYDAQGRRITQPSSGRRGKASPNRRPTPDSGAAA